MKAALVVVAQRHNNNINKYVGSIMVIVVVVAVVVVITKGERMILLAVGCFLCVFIMPWVVFPGKQEPSQLPIRIDVFMRYQDEIRKIFKEDDVKESWTRSDGRLARDGKLQDV
jgi:ATP/ADP translocase